MGMACTCTVYWGKASDNWAPWEVTWLGSFERYLPKKSAYRMSSCQQKEPGGGVRTGTCKGPRSVGAALHQPGNSTVGAPH